MLFFGAQAQLVLSSADADFGDVMTTDQKEIIIDMTNKNSYPIKVVSTVSYNNAFECVLENSQLGVGEQEQLVVVFEPTQNLAYNSELLIVLDDGSEYRIDIHGNGRYQDDYYASTFNKSYQELKDELKSILANNYVNLGYTKARDYMYGDIDNQGGQVTCVYTGRTSTFNTRSGANNNSMNCEHTWPQSLYNSNEPERADIHHLFPTDVGTNSRRSNHPFGVVANPSWTEGGSKYGSSVFEPRNEHKGTAARAMFYFAIRYTDYGNFIDNQENVLKQWHITYPPSAWDKQRNEKIFGYQKNRNPFVDHPEFIERIGNFGSNDPNPKVKSVTFTQEEISYPIVSPFAEKVVYLVNDGNQSISNISKVTSRDGNIVVENNETSVDAGECSAITISFKDLPNGSYTDELVVDLNTQIGKVLRLPIQFEIGQAGLKIVDSKLIHVRYNNNLKVLQIDDVPPAAETLEIWNTHGQLILNDISSPFNDIPFESHPSGIYFALIKSKNHVIHLTKFLVNYEN